MSILIKGMEMPTEEEISKFIIIRHDGEVWIGEFDSLVDGGFVACYPTNPMRAVPVPPHGRLIDADALCKTLRSLAENEYTPEVFANWIENHIDTIIQAEGGPQ